MTAFINFGENLPEKELEDGFSESNKADLCLVLGSSLTVKPAASMPETVAKRGYNLVICNKQITPLDSLARYKIHASTDKLMNFIMGELKIPIPKWILRRFITVDCETNNNSRKISVGSIDSDGLEASIIKECKIIFPFNYSSQITQKNKEPFIFDNITCNFDINTLSAEEVMQWNNKKIMLLLNKANVNRSHALEKIDLVNLFLENKHKLPKEAKIVLTFMGHYSEPNYDFSLDLDQNSNFTLTLDYDVTTRLWNLFDKADKT